MTNEQRCDERPNVLLNKQEHYFKIKVKRSRPKMTQVSLENYLVKRLLV